MDVARVEVGLILIAAEYIGVRQAVTEEHTPCPHHAVFPPRPSWRWER